MKALPSNWSRMTISDVDLTLLILFNQYTDGSVFDGSDYLRNSRMLQDNFEFHYFDQGDFLLPLLIQGLRGTK